MAKKRAVAPEAELEEGEGGKYSLVIDPDLVQPLRLLAAALRVTIPALINSRIRKIVNEELDESLGTLGYKRVERGQ